MMTEASPPIAGRGRRSVPLIAALGPVFAVLGLLALVSSGFGYRWGLWNLHVAFTIFGVGGWVAAFGALLSLIGLVVVLAAHRGGAALATLGLIGGIFGGWTVTRWMHTAKHAMPIHDISTDLTNPPLFVAVLPLRATAPNPATPADSEVRAMQRKGYPDIVPLVVPNDPGHTFHAARDVAEHMGWAMVATDSAAGRIEATATTPWYGFKDDIVIRVAPSGSGSRVDVRSVSRLGGSDVGTNAARIRRFMHDVQRTL